MSHVNAMNMMKQDTNVHVNILGATVSQHARCQQPENEAAEWKSAIINFIIYALFLHTVTRFQKKI